jgi:hypothetical protein
VALNKCLDMNKYINDTILFPDFHQVTSDLGNDTSSNFDLTRQTLVSHV